MTPASTASSIESTVRLALAETLLVKPETLEPSTRLILDLGAESIDLLDLRFRLEKSLGIRISKDELLGSLGAGLTLIEFQERFTVDALCRFLASRIQSARA
jgi:acyl carrier protein